MCVFTVLLLFTVQTVKGLTTDKVNYRSVTVEKDGSDSSYLDTFNGPSVGLGTYLSV